MMTNRRNRFLGPLGIALVLGSSNLVFADVLHVPAGVATIQEAIEVAVDGDEVIVAPGIYHEMINLKGKALLVKSEKGPEATVLDGTGLLGSVVSCINGEKEETRIEGFTITGGSGDVNTYGPNTTIGGGLIVLGSSPSIVDCVFRENKVSLHGGAVYSGGGSHPQFAGCVFLGNKAEKGGAIFNIRSNSRITNCDFQENLATFAGGAIFNDRNSSPKLISCTFDQNEALYNGGAIYDYESHGSLVRCVFSRNTAAFKGGAVYSAYRSDAVMADCRFITPTDDVAGRMGVTKGSSKLSGACCLGSDCIIAEQQACIDAGGSFVGNGSICEKTITYCPTGNEGDLNRDGEVDRTDLAVLLKLWK